MAKNNYNETIIAQGVRIEGEFIAEGDIVIEGEVRGTITTAGDLRIGDAAKVEADIRAQNAIVSGEVRGTMHILGKLELMPTSKFTGDLAVDVLSVGAGAQVNGTVRMGEEVAQLATGGKKGKRAVETEE
ncbi:polymer-forming cytoskeletal protein [bacterium]|jgi:cytoskeletal protein CcmA (bactofilin family)|nr:polymer-forming cytoskeletal protein [bacterium]NBX49676.1 polymer-forming cytoskeletal protein [bacterium]